MREPVLDRHLPVLVRMGRQRHVKDSWIRNYHQSMADEVSGLRFDLTPLDPARNYIQHQSNRIELLRRIGPGLEQRVVIDRLALTLLIVQLGIGRAGGIIPNLYILFGVELG